MRDTRRQEITGTVISDKMDKTVVVQVENRKMHPRYKKYIKRRKNYKAHDEQNECRLGDMVKLMSTRPISKDKRWRVIEILRRKYVSTELVEDPDEMVMKKDRQSNLPKEETPEAAAPETTETAAPAEEAAPEEAAETIEEEAAPETEETAPAETAQAEEAPAEETAATEESTEEESAAPAEEATPEEAAPAEEAAAPETEEKNDGQKTGE